MGFRIRRLPSIFRHGLPLILLPFLCLGMTELVHRASISSFIIWMIKHPGEWIAGYLLMFGLLMILTLLLKQIYWAFAALNLITVTIASVSRVKLKFRGEPLLPWDLKLGGEAFDVASFFSMQSIAYTLLPILVAAAIGLAIIWKIPRPVYGMKQRLTLAVAGLLLLSGLFGGTMKAKRMFDLQTITWDQSMNYNQNGMFVGYLLNAQWMDVKTPAGYTKEAIDTITKEIDRHAPTGSGSVSPNVIMVMSEAFWDPTVMEQVEYSRDPIPFFRSLSETSTSGQMLAPVYGGGTVNTEFEALTGFSTNFIPAGSIAYSNYVRTPQDSLASILKRQGYEATAIHTYHNWFYRRNEVYKLLGFDRFISAEFFNNPEKKRGYISDRELSERIISEVKATEGPDFIYAVSMQNHGPYAPDKNSESPVRISGDLSEKAVGILETYAGALSDADDSLRILVEAFENSGEPTVIVFFGDHLPMLGEEYGVYREAGYFQDGTHFEDYLKMHSVPFVIWNNFSRESNVNYRNTYISTFHLGHMALELAGREGNALTEFLKQMFRSELTYVPKENFHSELNLNEAMLEQYSLLHYDRLFGNGFSYTNGHPAVSERYHLGSGLISIQNAEIMTEALSEDGFANEGGRTVLRVTGEHFISGGTVLVNGERADTRFVNDRELLIALPDHAANKPIAIRFQVIDSLDRVIAESNLFEASF
ncbi:LTA synthase family protein [Paenibacillus tarimensis]